MTETAYIPGMCNINRAEIAYRRKAMWFGIITTFILFMLLFVLHAPWWLAIPVLLVPVYIGAIGYLQVTNKFCVSYGASGRQNADDGSTTATHVIDDAARKADRAKTRRMNLQATAITSTILVVAAGFLYIL